MQHELLSRYETSAKAHGQATEAGDVESANRSHDEVIDALKELSALDRDLACLVPLLGRANYHVRTWAATHLLVKGSQKAEQTLEELCKCRGLIGFNAEIVLQEWRKGRLKLPDGV